MKLTRVHHVLLGMERIVRRGERFRWSGLTHIAQECGWNRQTTYRYLEALVKDGKVMKVKRSWRGEACYRYYMTPEGRLLLESFKRLPLDNVTN